MSLIVQKFGGTSVADSGRLRHVAQIITDTYKAGNQVVAVLSAQGDTTDELIEKAREINPGASTREMDMLLSTGEQISVALCAMAVEALGFPVVSLTGWQAGMVTNTVSMNARIKKVDTERIEAELDARRDRDRDRLSGNQPLRRRHHPGAGRIGHLGRGPGGVPARGSLPDIHRRGRRLHRGPAAGAPRQEAGRGYIQ